MYCIICNDDPCRCGDAYEEWTENEILEHIKMLKNILKNKKKINKINSVPSVSSVAEKVDYDI